MLVSLAGVLVLSLLQTGQERDLVGEALIACAPVNLDQAITCLDAHLPEEQKSDFASDYDNISEAHFGLGLWMRNNWQLWGGGPLAKSFNAVEITHPDDMSSLVLESYWLHLNDCPRRLDEQIAFYKDYWARSETAAAGWVEPPDLNCKAQQEVTAR